MPEHIHFIFAPLLIFLYGLISRKSANSPLTAPIFFVVAGLICGPAILGIYQMHLDHEVIKLIAETGLILVLFSDASTVSIKRFIVDRSVPVRLLFVGLPLTMVLGALLAWPIFPELPFASLLLMALILSPTDAALGLAVVQSKAVPEKVRRWINIESGLNDGISLPPILATMAYILHRTNQQQEGLALFITEQIGLGALAGILVGYFGGRLIQKATEHAWMSSTFARLSAVALAFISYGVAEYINGNGFISAYFAGLLAGTALKHENKENIQSFTETEGQQPVLILFLIFAIVGVPWAAPYWNAAIVLYSILSLTIIRMLPVFIVLIGCKVDTCSKLFIGWFGPRGIASILYLLVASHAIGLKGHETIFSTIVLTVLMSIFLHGLSAAPLVNIYAAHVQKKQQARTAARATTPVTPNEQ